MEQIARHIIFVGRVQGIGFRFTAFDAANRHRLTGMVRNLSDGTVEMFAQGFEKDIKNCVADIKKSYSKNIREIKIEEAVVNPRYEDFKITF
ncbi:MAG: acylphosphatase [Planctomycetes bacterium]|nr:acylphosphatase [Planctomycetota bacterium]MCK5472423.1 acylphosphatase [Planctomycetota bacterium]